MGCGTLEEVLPILSRAVYQIVSVLKPSQQSQTKPEPHQVGVTLQFKQKALEMPRNQKPSGKNAPQNGKVMPRNQKQLASMPHATFQSY